MVFRDEFETTEPTHKLVTRNLPDVKDWDEVGWISVENRALTVFMNYGAAVQFQLDPKHG
ncbi:hypothetical protein C499_12490 [Halogeometricum borinquense DSM 11551]|uniref:Uncharacterized protein n=2 Tax=Halogeometricum borinquense TaxID=60847 RepID=E4NWG8_HALBP|nr:hypothetical protein [Halogeometricum borinquense]ADQ69388.1 hypothetical protein Hbor_36820 [Halogeometricum borinquense DSM 11551]ELY26057.1 hypothetical protein C499_12490 [Halogeometricum borinquense DSM 11551]